MAEVDAVKIEPAPGLEAQIFEAVDKHPSKSQKPDGSFSFSKTAYTEIAAQFQVSTERVADIARKGGITRRSAVGSSASAEPLPYVGKSAAPKSKKARLSKVERELLCEGISKGFGALFSLVATFRGEEHWQLECDEAEERADNFIDAIETLEDSEAYEQFIRATSKAVPWGVLVAGFWQSITPRIDESRRLNRERHTNSTAAFRGAGVGAADASGTVPGRENPEAEYQDTRVYAVEGEYVPATPDLEQDGSRDFVIPE